MDRFAAGHRTFAGVVGEGCSVERFFGAWSGGESGACVSDSAFQLSLAASAVLDLLVAAVSLFWLMPGRKRGAGECGQGGEGGVEGSGDGGGGGEVREIGLWTLLGAVLMTGAFSAGKAFLLGRVGYRLFGFMSLAFVDVVVVCPLMALAVLWVARRGSSGDGRLVVARSVWLVAVASLMIVPMAVYGVFVEPFHLKIERVRVAVPAVRAGGQDVRIGVLSDLQTRRITDYERSAVAALMAERPDIIVIPGDLFQGSAHLARELDALRELLGELSAPGGVYFVPGNCEVYYDYARVLEGTPVELLVNRSVRVRVRDRWVTIAGVELFSTDRSLLFLDEVESLVWPEGETGREDIRIVVAHYPRRVLQLAPNSRVDLLIAGHTHGGQVRVPWFGPLITMSPLARDVAAGGLHELGGRRVYVSRGVGVERGQAPRIRFLCRPEVTVLTLGDGE